MAFLFRMLSLVPTAARVGVAGGAAYGSAKMGVWSDSTETEEKLSIVQKEIHYPSNGFYPFSEKSDGPGVVKSRTMTEIAQDSWNSGVMKACKTVATADGTDIKAATHKAYEQLSEYVKK